MRSFCQLKGLGCLAGLIFLVLLAEEANCQTLVRTIGSHEKGRIHRLQFSPDGRLIGAFRVGADGKPPHVAVYKADGREVYRFDVDPGPVITFLGFSPDSKTVLAGTLKGNGGKSKWGFVTVQVHDLQTKKRIRSFPLREGAGCWVRLSSGGKTLVASAIDCVAVIYDVETGEETGHIKSPEPLPTDGPDPVPTDSPLPTSRQVLFANVTNCLDVSPEGKLLAIGTQGGHVAVWNLATKKRLWRSEAHEGFVNAVAVSPDGKAVASVGGRRRGGDVVFEWSCDKGMIKAQMSSRPSANPLLAYGKEGPTLFLGVGMRGKLGFVARVPGELSWVGEAGPRDRDFTRLSAMAVAPDGKHLVTGDYEIKLWDVSKITSPKPGK